MFYSADLTSARNTVMKSIRGQMLESSNNWTRRSDNSNPDRLIVQVWNADQTELVATVMGSPEYLDNAPSANLFVFADQGKGLPPLLKAWFQAGNRNGERFIY